MFATYILPNGFLHELIQIVGKGGGGGQRVLTHTLLENHKLLYVSLEMLVQTPLHEGGSYRPTFNTFMT